MRKAFLPFAILGILAAAALAGPAAAAPSSNSAVNEYTERLPDPGGGQSNGEGQGGNGESGPGGGSTGASEGGGSTGGSTLPSGTAQELESSGAAGNSLKGIVEETGSAPSSGSGASASADGDGSDGLLNTIGGALSDFAGGSDTGLGVGFPILLLAALLGAGALVLRSRGGTGPHTDA